jgi:hypothetical protein
VLVLRSERMNLLDERINLRRSLAVHRLLEAQLGP